MALIRTADLDKIDELFDQYESQEYEGLKVALAFHMATLRSGPQVPPLRPQSVGEVPVLRGDDIFRITGRGLVVTLNLDHQPISNIRLGDHVKFDARTVSSQTVHSRNQQVPLPAIDPDKVYEVTGIEQYATFNPGPKKGLLVKPIGYEVSDSVSADQGV